MPTGCAAIWPRSRNASPPDSARRPGCRSVAPHWPSPRLDRASPHLAFNTPHLRCARRLGGDALSARHADTADEVVDPRERRRAIHVLRAMLLRLDDDDTIARDTAVGEHKQPRLDVLRQRRRTDIEAQMNRARNLVDVLTARALRAHGRQFDLMGDTVRLSVIGRAPYRTLVGERWKTGNRVGTSHSPSKRMLAPRGRRTACVVQTRSSLFGDAANRSGARRSEASLS